MKTGINSAILYVTAFVLLAAALVQAQPAEDFDETLSPYFMVVSDDPDTDSLPLKSTRADVHISGVIADVVVTQVYKNEGTRPLEAIYVFPASTRAAVHGMKMTIGERTITARINNREAARQEYEQARQEGKSASLLEQQRPNVFQMNVANILPNDVIQVELRYTELLVPADAEYVFVYPTVVGPRYTGGGEDTKTASENWTANPYLRQGQPPSNTFDIAVNLSAGLPIQEIACSSHRVNVDYRGKEAAEVRLARGENNTGNRDFILKYRLAGGKIESGLLLYEGREENYFLLMLQPPKEVMIDQIPSREYMFVVDISGSMHGFPLDISKKLLKDLIEGLRPEDRFNVLLFAGSSQVMAEESLPATAENLRRAMEIIDRQKGGGGTELLPALKQALNMGGTEGFSRSVIIVTDGYVSVEEETFDLIRNRLGQANIFAFGIGSSVNRHLIEGMARVGMGEPFVVTNPEEAAVKAEKLRKLLEKPVLTNIRINFKEFDAYAVEPPSIPDVMANRPVIVFGKWRGKPKGIIDLSGTSGNGSVRERINVGKVKPQPGNVALQYLWARHRIALLDDYNRLQMDDNRVAEVTRLGLTHSLLTAYTSFVAVDNQVRTEGGESVRIEQPLPLPQGVSDYAVGGTALRGVSAPAPAGFLSGKAMLVQKQERADYRSSHAEPEEEFDKSSTGLCRIEITKIEVSAGLSKAMVKRSIEEHISQLRQCCLGLPAEGSPVSGIIEIVLTISSDGRVQSVVVPQTAQENFNLEDCLRNELKNLVFPVNQQGKPTTVTVKLQIS